MNGLQCALTQYIAMRRAFGAKLREPPRTLGHFLEFLQEQGSDFITTELALRWAMQPEGVQRATWARRLSMVRRFAEWLHAIEPRTQIPPTRALSAGRQRNPPHIYTPEQQRDLIAESRNLRSRRGLRSHTYVAIIGLLASTGLRPGEVLALNLQDVDLKSGILFIRDSKHGKSRFVPIHDSTRCALIEYSVQRDRLSVQGRSNAFFTSDNGGILHSCALRRTFAKLSMAIGLRNPMERGRSGRGPRLQDFRHTFATQTLLRWYQSGVNVERELPTLSTYLGHSEVTHTYWYFSSHPELLQLANKLLCGRHPRGER